MGADGGDIDDVQELHRAQPLAVPPRYIRDGEERPALSKIIEDARIPVIDVAKLDGGDVVAAEAEMASLAAACRDWGFFQVVDHDLDVMLMHEMETVAREFFMLPLVEKTKYPMAPGTIQGYGHAFVFSDEQKLDWCDMLALGVHPPSIRKPALWPTTPASFSETLEEYSKGVRRLCRRLLSAIAGTLGLPVAVFDGMFGEAVQAVRMNYYPPCPRPDAVLGLSSHSDGSAITLLQQEASAGAGLQVLHGDAWVSVRPIADALVINIGDTMEVLTNGKYKSVEHRAVTDGERDRLSIVTFYAPCYEMEVGPMPEFLGDGRPARYRRYSHGDFNRHYVTNRLQGKKSLDFAKINADAARRRSVLQNNPWQQKCNTRFNNVNISRSQI